MTDSPFIITGMHRSGTSFAAQGFYKAGVFLGNPLMEENQFNQDGHFEAMAIVKFHDELLAVHGSCWSDERGLRKKIHFTKENREKALQLLQSQFEGQAIWGWKDPRTALFLDFWKDLLPHAKFVFIFREPGAVVESLLKRNDFKRSKKLSAVWKSLQLWKIYNEIILKFACQHTRRSLLIEIPKDLNSQREQFFSEIICRWEPGLPRLNFSENFKPHLFHKQVSCGIKALASLSGAYHLYSQLRTLQTFLCKPLESEVSH